MQEISNIENTDDLANQALAFHNKGQLSEAEDLYQTILSIDSNNCQVLNLLGHLYYQIGNYKLAIELVSQAIFIEPDRSDLYRTAGKICFATRNFEDAIDAFRRAIELGDRAAENYDNLIDALEAIDRHEEVAQVLSDKHKIYKFNLPYTRKFSNYIKYEVGKYTYGAPIVKDWHQGSTLKIGDFCSIAENVTILLGGNHPTDWVSSFPFGVIFEEFQGRGDKYPEKMSKGNVVIGNDVWIGLNSTILSGITIGDGAVIAANAVVTKNVEPYTIVGGNPAKILKERFSDEAISKLLVIKWWNWDIDRIEASLDLMLSDNIELFINRHFPIT